MNLFSAPFELVLGKWRTSSKGAEKRNSLRGGYEFPRFFPHPFSLNS